MAPQADLRLQLGVLLVEQCALFEDFLDETWAARDEKSARRRANAPPITARAPIYPNATVEFPIGNTGPCRGRWFAVNRAGIDRGSEIGGATQGGIGVPGP